MSAQWLRNFFAKWQSTQQPTGWQRVPERNTDGTPAIIQYPLHQPAPAQSERPFLAYRAAHPITPIPATRQQTGPIPIRDFERLPTMPASPRLRKFVALPLEDEQPSQSLPELQPLPHWIEASVEALAPARKQLTSENLPTLPPERFRAGSNSRPLWMEPIVRDALADVPTSHPQLQDVNEQDCEPDLSEGDGENEPTALSRKVRDQRAIELLLGSAKESENTNAND